MVGTLEYLPPEYAQGTDSGPARDIWAVGVLAFEMLVGKHPFDGLKENEKWAKLVKVTLTRPSNPPNATAKSSRKGKPHSASTPQK